jgi:hypothetical protein
MAKGYLLKMLKVVLQLQIQILYQNCLHLGDYLDVCTYLYMFDLLYFCTEFSINISTIFPKKEKSATPGIC